MLPLLRLGLAVTVALPLAFTFDILPVAVRAMEAGDLIPCGRDTQWFTGVT